MREASIAPAQSLPGSADAAVVGACAQASGFWVKPCDLQPELLAEWDDLVDQASEPNPFAEPWCLLSGIRHFDQDQDSRLAVIRSGDHGPLIGIMPLTTGDHYGRLPLNFVTNWSHPNAFHGAPMVRHGHEHAFWHGLLDLLDRSDWTRHLLHWSRITLDGPLHHALCDVAMARGRACDIVHSEFRALLKSELGPDAYWEDAVRAKKRKELRRQANRLSDLGTLRVTSWQADQPLTPWLDDFLALERSGWKGRNGSALDCAADTRGWFMDIMADAAARQKLDIMAMTLDGRPIAMLIHLISGRGGFSFKTAFDEELARFSPGVLLQQHNLAKLTWPGLDWIDSCASEGHPMIDSIWRQRRQIVRISVPLHGRINAMRFRLVRFAEDSFARLKGRTPPHIALARQTGDTQPDDRP